MPLGGAFGTNIRYRARVPTTMSDVNALRGAEMSRDEMSAFLREQGIGTLSLAWDGDAYAVPISFGYADGPPRLYFDLVRFGDESRKVEYAERTTQACFVTYDARSRFDWRSVVAVGEIREVPESDREEMDEVMEDNAWFPSLFPPSEPMTGVRRSVLHVEEVTGRKGESRQG